MIESIGIDIVDVDKIHRAISRWGDRFLRKVLTEDEYRYCIAKPGRDLSVAVRFAAKEALYKSLPEDIQKQGPRWLDVEVINASSGKPGLKCSGVLKNLLQDYHLHVSLSHSNTSAVAMVVLERNEVQK